MVSLRGFEPPFSTFARLRVLHLRYRLSIWRKRSDSNAHRISPGTLVPTSRDCHTIRRRFQTFSIADCQMPICVWSHGLRSLFPFPKHSQEISIRFILWPIGNGQSEIGNELAEGEGVEPSRRIARPGFQDQLRAAAHHLPNLARMPRFELRSSGLESDGLPVSPTSLQRI